MAETRRPAASVAKRGNPAFTAAALVVLAATFGAVYLFAADWSWQAVSLLAFVGVVLSAVLGYLGDRTSMSLVREESGELVGFSSEQRIPRGSGEIAVETVRIENEDSADWYEYRVEWRAESGVRLLETFRDAPCARSYAERLCLQGSYPMTWSGLDDVTERRSPDELDLTLVERLRKEPGRVPPMPPPAARPARLAEVEGGGVRMNLSRLALMKPQRWGVRASLLGVVLFLNYKLGRMQLLGNAWVQAALVIAILAAITWVVGSSDELTATPNGVKLRRTFLGIGWRERELKKLEGIYVENRSSLTHLALATDGEYLLVGAFGRIDDAHRARGLLYRGLAGAGLKED